MIFSSSATKCVDPVSVAIGSAGTYAAIRTYRYFFPPKQTPSPYEKEAKTLKQENEHLQKQLAEQKEKESKEKDHILGEKKFYMQQALIYAKNLQDTNKEHLQEKKQLHKLYFECINKLGKTCPINPKLIGYTGNSLDNDECD